LAARIDPEDLSIKDMTNRLLAGFSQVPRKPQAPTLSTRGIGVDQRELWGDVRSLRMILSCAPPVAQQTGWEIA
jgi:hypothetical protein